MIGTGHHINWPPIGLALLLALLGFWLNHMGSRIEVVDTAGFGHDPDFIVEHFDALAFDVQGMPYQRLAAARMTHYMDDDTTVLDAPFLRNLDPAAPFTVKAKRALISGDRAQAYFLDDVYVERLPEKGRPAMTLETEYLHVSRSERFMRTDKPVTVRQGRSSVTADAMLVDDKSKLLSLDGHVRGTYEIAR